MSVDTMYRCPAERIARALERQIATRTDGRIHQLRVEVRGDRLAVFGVTALYYSKQLALLAIREVLGAMPVDEHIEVASPSSVAPVGQRAAGSATAQGLQ